MALQKIGASIVLEGEKSYREALKGINTEQKALRSEMALSQAEFKDEQNSLDALSSKYEILSKQIESQKSKIDVYNTALESAKEAQDASAQNVQKYSEELDKAQAELEQMKSSGEASAEAIKAQEEAVAKAQAQLQQAETEYQKNTNAVNNWQTGLNVAQTQLIKMNDDLEKTGQYMEEARNSTDKTATSIDQFGNELSNASEGALTFGDVLKANLASEVVMEGLKTLVNLTKQAGKGLWELATNAAYYADEINTMSTVTGVSTDTIQALKYSEELLDTSLQTVTSSMAKNIKQMEATRLGTGTAAGAYEELGVRVTDLNGNLRDGETVFWEVIDALGKVDSVTQRDAISMQIFGKKAQELNPLIKAGSEGFAEMKKEAQEMGYILDTEALDSLNETSDSLERLSKTGDAIKREIGAELTEQFADALDRILVVIQENEEELQNVAETVIPALADGIVFLVEHLDEIIPILTGIATGFVAMKVEGLAMSAVNTVMSLFATKTTEATVAQEGLNTAMAANPVGLIVAGLGMAVGALTSYLTEQNKALDAANQYKTAITDEQTAILNNVKARGEAQKAYSNSGDATKKLIDRLKELRSETVLTRDEQSEMAQIVDQLNSAYPDLNLEIIENGNNLNMTNEAIEKNCELMQQQLNIQNAMDDLSEISKEQYESQVRMAPLIKEQEQATQEYLEAKKALKEADDADFATQMALYDAYQAKSEALSAIGDQVAAEEKIQRDLNEQYQVATDYINENKEAYEANSKAVEDLETAIVNYHGKAVTITGEEATAIHELRAAYDEAKAAAQDSLNQQIGLFDELSLKSDLTVSQMKSNLESQTTVMNTYSEDMLKAAQLVEDGLMDEGLLGEIKDMGIQGAGYLHELVTSAETDGDKFKEVMDSWSDMEDAKNNLASTMAEIETNFNETQDSIVQKSQETQDTISENAEHWKANHVDIWSGTYSSVKKAIDDSKSDVETSSGKVAQGAVDKSKDVLEIDEQGESGKGKEIGGSYGGSVATGILDSESEILDAIDSIFDAADERARSRASNLDRIMGEAFGG
jgi:chromosome segregation ATPase